MNRRYGIIPDFLLEEKNIERLRDVCITAWEFTTKDEWLEIIKFAVKRHDEREGLI